MVAGLYCFAYVGLPDDPARPNRGPEAQADLHWAWCKSLILKGDLLPFVDCEYPRPEAWGKPLPGVHGNPTITADKCRDWLRRHLDRWTVNLGRTPGVYFDEQWMRALAPDASFASSPAWIASWAPYVRPIAPWAGWAAWQTSGGGGHLPDGAPIDTDVIADEVMLSTLRM
jgi:hypothetical protein